MYDKIKIHQLNKKGVYVVIFNFKMRGNQVKINPAILSSITKKDLEKGIQAGNKGREEAYFVEFKGQLVPLKRFFYVLLKKCGYNYTLLDFTTQDALRVIRKLGVPLKCKKKSIWDLAGSLSIGGNALEDKRKIYES